VRDERDVGATLGSPDGAHPCGINPAASVQAAGFNPQSFYLPGELRRRLIRAFLEENVRVPFPPHVVVTGA
jgi:hypothetical protein